MQTDYTFEQLPLILNDEAGRQCGTILVDGSAAIDYGPDRWNWEIKEIEIEAVRLGRAVNPSQWPGMKVIAVGINNALRNEVKWKGRVQDAVDFALRQDAAGEDSAFRRAYARQVQV